MGNKVYRISGLSEEAVQVSSSDRLPDEVYIDIATDQSLGTDGKIKMSKDVNVRAVMNSLRNIFTWIPGERILNPEFGETISRHLYQGITQFNVEQIMSGIRSLCSRWEPRVRIVDVIDKSTVEDTEDNTVHLEIVFTIPGLSDRQYTYSYIYNRAS